jgi:hypothetical protein
MKLENPAAQRNVARILRKRAAILRRCGECPVEYELQRIPLRGLGRMRSMLEGVHKSNLKEANLGFDP